MKRETNFAVAIAGRDGHVAFAIRRMATAVGMSPKAWHKAKQGELTDEEAQEYDRYMVEFDKQWRASELERIELNRILGRKPVDELAALRQQVATLTQERDAANAKLAAVEAILAACPIERPRPLDELYRYEGGDYVVNTARYDLADDIRMVLRDPPRLDSEGARLPFAQADDSEVAHDL